MFLPDDLVKFKTSLTKYQNGDQLAGIAIIRMNHFQTIIGRECSKHIPEHELRELQQICHTIILHILKDFKLPEDSNGGHILSYINKFLGRRLNDKLKRMTMNDMEVSLQTPIGSDEDEASTLEDILPDPDSLDMEDRIALKVDLERAIHKLTPNQQKLIKLSFYMGYTHEEIATYLIISRVAVTQALQRAVEALKTELIDYYT